MNRATVFSLLAALLVVGCEVPFNPLPPTEVDKRAKQYNAVVVERRDSGMYQTHARLLDGSQVWRSSGRNATESLSSRTSNPAAADRQLAEAMRQGVEP